MSQLVLLEVAVAVTPREMRTCKACADGGSASLLPGTAWCYADKCGPDAEFTSVFGRDPRHRRRLAINNSRGCARTCPYWRERIRE